MTNSVLLIMQQGDTVSFRPYLYVLLAFAAGWVFVGAWVFLIGQRVRSLARLIGDEGSD
jgi:hypothetical protein